MDGIQKTVALGLRKIADDVEKGVYGINEDAFYYDDEDDGGGKGQAFLDAIHDEVFDKME